MKINIMVDSILDDLELLLRELNDFSGTNSAGRLDDEIPELLQNYLNYVAKTGNTLFPWNEVRPLFKFKLNSAIGQFQGEPSSIEPSVFERFDLFRAAPFTIQRLAELITQPQKHYKTKEKFVCALEKTVFVVSTVDPTPPYYDDDDGFQNGKDEEMDSENVEDGMAYEGSGQRNNDFNYNTDEMLKLPPVDVSIETVHEALGLTEPRLHHNINMPHEEDVSGLTSQAINDAYVTVGLEPTSNNAVPVTVTSTLDSSHNIVPSTARDQGFDASYVTEMLKLPTVGEASLETVHEVLGYPEAEPRLHHHNINFGPIDGGEPLSSRDINEALGAGVESEPVDDSVPKIVSVTPDSIIESTSGGTQSSATGDEGGFESTYVGVDILKLPPVDSSLDVHDVYTDSITPHMAKIESGTVDSTSADIAELASAGQVGVGTEEPTTSTDPVISTLEVVPNPPRQAAGESEEPYEAEL